MKVLYDTSVLIAGLLQSHPKYPQASEALRQARNGEVDASVAAHSLAEFYASLSGMLVIPRVSPRAAVAQIQDNILPFFEIVALDPADYSSMVERISVLGLSGGVIYDALIGCAAEKAGADRLLTLNCRDFDRLDLGLEIREP